MSLSDTERAEALRKALNQHYAITPNVSPDPQGFWIEEVFDDYVIYNIKGDLYRVGFTMEEDTPVLGEPEAVDKKVTFTPRESLQRVYSEFLQHAAGKKVNLSEPVYKSVLESCRIRLQDETVALEVVTPLMESIKKLEEKLGPLETVKWEENIPWPKGAYAYAPGDDPATWRLRLWESPGGTVTKNTLNRAAAYLSPGGYKGIKVGIMESDLPAVRRRLRNEYRALGIDDDNIPRWAKGDSSREWLNAYMPLSEAKIDKGRATVIVIKPGFNFSKDRYYPVEMLKRDYKVFEGQKMYADHPTKEEDKARPERTIKDWVAVLKDVTVDESGVVTGVAEVLEPWLMAKLASLRERGLLSEMGISINAIGAATKGTIDGKDTLIIEQLVSSRSVDFVTEPGAGGIVTFYESDRAHDVDLIDVAELRSRRPDIVKIIENDARAVLKQEVQTRMETEARIKELEEANEALTKERDGLKEANEKAVRDAKVAGTKAEVAKAVESSGLPDATKARLLKQFDGVESLDGLAEAIKAEKDYIAELSEAGIIKKMGESKRNEKDPTVEELMESFRKLNPNATDEQLRAMATA